MIKYIGTDTYEVSIDNLNGTFSKYSLLALLDEILELEDFIEDTKFYQKGYENGIKAGYKKGYVEAKVLSEPGSSIYQERYEQGYVDGYNQVNAQCDDA